MPHVVLKVEVPLASFRASRAREYMETYDVPPPATIYGMLLSLVGETNRYKHCGVRIAVVLLSEPTRSVVLRKFHRHKVGEPYHPSNIRPDFQEVLTDIRFMVWVDGAKDQAEICLADRIFQAFEKPTDVDRFGGLSLGESQFLVNSVNLISEESLEGLGTWLIQNGSGHLSLPHWVDHVGARGTRWHLYSLQKSCLKRPPDSSWIGIQPA